MDGYAANHKNIEMRKNFNHERKVELWLFE